MADDGVWGRFELAAAPFPSALCFERDNGLSTAQITQAIHMCHKCEHVSKFLGCFMGEMHSQKR